MMIIERHTARTQEKLAPGKHTIEVDTMIAKPGAPPEVVLAMDGEEVARTTVQRTVPAAFTASETFDVGIDLGSPVCLSPTSTGGRSGSRERTPQSTCS
jgi:hypothetical protein